MSELNRRVSDFETYDGGGTSNALQLAADLAAVVAGGAEVVPLEGISSLNLSFVHAGAAESATVVMSVFSIPTISEATWVATVPIYVPLADGNIEVNLTAFGLTGACYAKPLTVLNNVMKGYAVFSIAAQSGTGAKYLKIQKVI